MILKVFIYLLNWIIFLYYSVIQDKEKKRERRERVGWERGRKEGRRRKRNNLEALQLLWSQLQTTYHKINNSTHGHVLSWNNANSSFLGLPVPLSLAIKLHFVPFGSQYLVSNLNSMKASRDFLKTWIFLKAIIMWHAAILHQIIKLFVFFY